MYTKKNPIEQMPGLNLLQKTFLKAKPSQKFNSSDFFKDNKIATAARVDKVKGTADQFRAIPFYQKRKTKQYPTKSQWINSWNNTVHCRGSQQYAGMGGSKKLTPYNPNAARNRILTQSFRPYYRNSSVLQMGNRSQRDTKHYITNYGNSIGKKLPQPNHHPGITAYRNRWLNHQIAK